MSEAMDPMNEARRGGDALPAIDQYQQALDRAGLITCEEANEILCRYNASHFRGRGPKTEEARYSIPVNPRWDDDIRLAAFIRRAQRVEALAARVERLFATLDHVPESSEEREEFIAIDAEFAALGIGQ